VSSDKRYIYNILIWEYLRSSSTGKSKFKMSKRKHPLLSIQARLNTQANKYVDFLQKITKSKQRHNPSRSFNSSFYPRMQSMIAISFFHSSFCFVKPIYRLFWLCIAVYVYNFNRYDLQGPRRSDSFLPELRLRRRGGMISVMISWISLRCYRDV